MPFSCLPQHRSIFLRCNMATLEDIRQVCHKHEAITSKGIAEVGTRDAACQDLDVFYFEKATTVNFAQSRSLVQHCDLGGVHVWFRGLEVGSCKSGFGFTDGLSSKPSEAFDGFVNAHRRIKESISMPRPRDEDYESFKLLKLLVSP